MKLKIIILLLAVFSFETIGFLLYMPTKLKAEVGSSEFKTCMLFGGVGLVALITVMANVINQYRALTSMRVILITIGFSYLWLAVFKQDAGTITISAFFVPISWALAYLYYKLDKIQNYGNNRVP